VSDDRATLAGCTGVGRQGLRAAAHGGNPTSVSSIADALISAAVSIEEVVEAARSVIDKPIHLVVGGTHLLRATPDEITRIATALRDDWKVAWIAPVHCTGEPAFAILKESFGDRYLYAGLGTTLELGPKVTMKAEAGQPPKHAMALEDVIDYRVALAHQMLDALPGRRVRLASTQP
jgi:hypothetical protein